MFGMNKRGMDSAIVKIVFVTISLVLAAVAVKSAYAGYLSTQTTVALEGAQMAPQEAIQNLTRTIAGNV